MITFENVSKTYFLSKEQEVQAVRELNLRIDGGEFVIITGRSGSGKTTLLNLAAGLTRPTSGRVLVDSVDLNTLGDLQRAALRGQKIGFVFQFPSLLPSLTVLENVRLPVVFANGQQPVSGTERAVELLKSVGLSDKLSAYPRQLSAGQQQRVVIARALINQPEMIMADEPTSNLDEQTELEIMALFRDIFDRTGITMVMVTHTTQLVRYGTRSIGMAGGRVVEG